MTHNKSTNVTLTLPKWLYTIAKQKDINLSQTLKEALKAKLGIEE
jgi:post-segregation antitoxin (ccd killing protein)